MEDKKVAVIIVNWNGKKYLKNCLDAVFNQTYKDFDIYFVDNGSIDNSVGFVSKNFHKVNIIKLDKNYGFAKGNNEGIKEAFKDIEVEYIVCLNNDTIVDQSWLIELIKTVNKDEKIGAVGSKILFYGQREKINSLGIVPLKTGGALNYGKNEDSSKYLKEEDIFGPCAASALYTRNCLKKTGLFDESYFCYLEDVDLAWKINLAGFKCKLNPKSFLYHIHSGTSSGNNKFKSYLIVRNSLYNLIKYMSIKEILLYIPNTLGYYKILSKRENIGSELKKASKSLFILNHLKAGLIILIKLNSLIKKRRERLALS